MGPHGQIKSHVRARMLVQYAKGGSQSLDLQPLAHSNSFLPISIHGQIEGSVTNVVKTTRKIIVLSLTCDRGSNLRSFLPIVVMVDGV